VSLRRRGSLPGPPLRDLGGSRQPCGRDGQAKGLVTAAGERREPGEFCSAAKKIHHYVELRRAVKVAEGGGGSRAEVVEVVVERRGHLFCD